MNRGIAVKINFVLPGPMKGAAGGYKMVYEYANRLTELGHEVMITFDCSFDWNRHKTTPFLVKWLWYRSCTWYYPKWFALNPKVRKIFAYKDLKDANLPDADIVCATAVGTAAPVLRLPPSKGHKMYLIQDFENWGIWTAQDVLKTYHYGMKNIVVANFLQKIVEDDGAECVLIPNGIDFKVFNLDNPIEKRHDKIISMLYHMAPYKGSKYGIAALVRLKKKYPDLQAILFGVPKRPVDLPEWIEYVQSATQEQLRKIYNHSLIYLCPSLKEGFGLTGAEAMACGAAYVASDYGGVHEYTEAGRNVLLSPPKDVDGLVKNISYLIDHNDARIKQATQGYQDIQSLDWNKSVDKFEVAMREAVAGR